MSNILVYMWIRGLMILGISVVIMLVMIMYYDSIYVWFSSCFYLYMNEKCIYGLMDEIVAKVIRK